MALFAPDPVFYSRYPSSRHSLYASQPTEKMRSVYYPIIGHDVPVCTAGVTTPTRATVGTVDAALAVLYAALPVFVSRRAIVELPEKGRGVVPGWYVSQVPGARFDVLAADFGHVRHGRVLRHQVRVELRGVSSWHDHVQRGTIDHIGDKSDPVVPSFIMPLRGINSSATVDVQTWETTTRGTIVQVLGGASGAGTLVGHIRINVRTPEWLQAHGILGRDGFPFRPNVAPVNPNVEFRFGFWN